MIIMSYYVLKDIKFFPWELLGGGEMWKLYEEEDPFYYHFYRPPWFDVLYIMNLTYYLSDFVHLVLYNENQSDYYLMILHHFATIFLFVLSFITNLSNIGCIVFFLHSIGNVFVYLCRIFMHHDNFPFLLKLTLGISLAVVWIYTRLYIYAKLLVIVWYGLAFNNWVVYYLYSLKLVLYAMHIHWILKIFNIVFTYGKTKTPTDVYKLRNV